MAVYTARLNRVGRRKLKLRSLQFLLLCEPALSLLFVGLSFDQQRANRGGVFIRRRQIQVLLEEDRRALVVPELAMALRDVEQQAWHRLKAVGRRERSQRTLVLAGRIRGLTD